MSRLHALAASLLVGATPYPVLAKSLTLEASESWQPFVRGTLVAVGGAAAEADPRATNHKITLALTETDETGAVRSSLTTGQLDVRDVQRNERTGEFTINVASGEAMAQDRAHMGTTNYGPTAFGGIRETIEDMLVRAGVPTSRQDLSALPAGTSPALANGTIVLPGDPWWRALSDLPQRIGWQLYCGLDGIWRLAEAAPIPTAPVATVAVGRDIEEYLVQVSRDDTGQGQWADGVAVVYTWTNSSGVVNRVVGRWSAAATGGNPTRVLRVTVDEVPVTLAQADARAAQLGARAYARGREYRLTVPARYDLRPRTFIDVVGPTGTPARVYVAALSWDLPAATTTITAWEA